ncbi:MAG: hypothetical protein NTV34_19445 [Proteobacteria bacterium]|nr:hypothetical protein [Pseudomonadota bacterium]
MPQKFLTKKSISISPYGWTRLTNSPFSAILSSDASFSKEELKRLDSMSCVGCHQQQAVAGFHVLGIDDSLTEKFLTPLAPFSSYFDGIQLWRSDQVKRLASGRRQTPFPIVNRSHDGTTGDACGEGQSCAAHFSCQKRRAFQSYGDNLGGLCEPNKDSDSVVGDPCDSSHLNTFEDAFRDEFIPGFHDSCGKGGVCAYAKAGFPGGYCSKPCTLTETATTCTPVPVLGNFSICVDRFGTFRTCAKNHSILSDMKLCTKVNDCRRDYTCVYRDEKSAICVPPYFLPDLTLGQHN